MAFEDEDDEPDTIGWRLDTSGDTYDTSELGQANTGHLSGDELDDVQRTVLE